MEAKVGSIHSKESIEKFKKIGADEVVLSLLQDGLKLQFDDYREIMKINRRNNASAREKPEEVKKIISKWLKCGYIRETTRDQVDCILPLTLARRKIHKTKSWKYRLCLDCTGRSFYKE